MIESVQIVRSQVDYVTNSDTIDGCMAEMEDLQEVNADLYR